MSDYVIQSLPHAAGQFFRVAEDDLVIAFHGLQTQEYAATTYLSGRYSRHNAAVLSEQPIVKHGAFKHHKRRHVYTYEFGNIGYIGQIPSREEVFDHEHYFRNKPLIGGYNTSLIRIRD